MFKYGYKVFLVYNKRIFHVETRLGHFTAWAQGLGIAAVAPYSIQRRDIHLLLHDCLQIV